MADIPNPGAGVLVKHRYRDRYKVLNRPEQLNVYTKGNNPMWYEVDYQAEIASKPKVEPPKNVVIVEEPESVTVVTTEKPAEVPEVVEPSPKKKRVTVASLLKEHGLKRADIRGTGKNGKVTISDVREYIGG